ncbi:MAG TPA: YrhB domain-containing protein [Candidatus Acidoferrum sp.]|nr:YrhB domain-containing protein [Candidatus Acidoferrum sp.]
MSARIGQPPKRAALRSSNIALTRSRLLATPAIIFFVTLGFLWERVSMANQHAETLSKERATEIARKTIDDLKATNPLVILEDKTLEKDFGWVFFYTTKKYQETRDKKYLMPGNSPLIVDRFDGSTHFLPSSLPPGRAVEEYQKAWRSKQKTTN